MTIYRTRTPAEPFSGAPYRSPQDGAQKLHEAGTMMPILELREETPRLDALPKVPRPGRTASIRVSPKLSFLISVLRAPESQALNRDMQVHGAPSSLSVEWDYRPVLPYLPDQAVLGSRELNILL